MTTIDKMMQYIKEYLTAIESYIDDNYEITGKPEDIIEYTTVRRKRGDFAHTLCAKQPISHDWLVLDLFNLYLKERGVDVDATEHDIIYTGIREKEKNNDKKI